MKQKDRMLKMLGNCNIFLNDALISKEQLIHAYSEFLIGNFVSKDKVVALTLHTGSKCFDVISILIASFGTLFLDTVSIDEVLEALSIGDMVLYKSERYFWGGFGYIQQKEFLAVEAQSSATHFLLEQNRPDKNLGEVTSKSMCPISNKNHISPYCGCSTTTDGRGIRNKKKIRTEFIETVFGIHPSEIQDVCGASTVIVADREYLTTLIEGVYLEFGNQKKCCLLDIVTASYFTESDEYPLRGNAGKNDPVIKFTSKVSVARDLIFDKTGNFVVSLFVFDAKSIFQGKSELPELISRKSLKFISLCADFDSNYVAEILSGFEITEFFACTNRFMQSYTTRIISNQVTNELFLQMTNSLQKNIVKKILPSVCTFDQYRKVKQALFLIRRHDFENIDKQDFLIEAYSLLNLFSTAVFPFDRLASMLAKSLSVSKILTLSEKIKKLWELAYKLPATLADNAIIVLELIELLMKQSEPLKYIELKKLLYYSNHKKIAVIVPKAYYIEILRLDKSLCLNNVLISTANKFNKNIQYDEIIVVGDFGGKQFDVFRNNSTPKITVLLYGYEAKFFNAREQSFNKFEENVNSLIFNDTKEAIVANDVSVDEIDLFEAYTAELDEYIENIHSLNILRYAARFTSQNATMVGEVVAVGIFATGEKILFSKYYKAVVLEKVKEMVVETEVDKLAQGDTLVFTKRNNFTKSIVDDIFDDLITNKKVPNSIIKSDFNSKYWKLLLQEYMENNGLTFKDISFRLSKMGCKRHEFTIKTWLGKDYGIIGPNDEEAFVQIAKLTGDKDMIADPRSFYNACKDIRHIRRKILTLIGQAIMDIYSGNRHSKDEMLSAVYENVENIAFTLELESVAKLDEHLNIAINLINKPIAEEE